MTSSPLRVFCFRISIMCLSLGSSYSTAAGALRSWKWMGAASKESSLTRQVTKVKLSESLFHRHLLPLKNRREPL